MKSWGLLLAAATLSLIGACGSSEAGQDQAATKATPTLDKLTVEQACVQAEMITTNLGGQPGSWSIAEYAKYGEQIAALADESDAEVGTKLQAAGDRAINVGSMDGEDTDAVSNAAGEWASAYQALTDVCARTSAPLTRLSY